MEIIFVQINHLIVLMLLLQLIPISLCTMTVNHTKENHNHNQHQHQHHGQPNIHQTRLKRSKADRWPSNLETWQFNNGKQNGIKTSSSSLNSQSVPLTPSAQNIKCNIRGDVKSFTSMITLPSGYTVPPIFEDYIDSNGETSSSSSSSQADCSMTLISSSSQSPLSSKSNTYSMKITDFAKCGVKSEKSADGKEWMSVTLRIPFINGLRTAQDEHIVIVCRPQEAVMAKNSLLDFKTNLQRPVRTVFSSLEPEVEVKVGLFAKPSGVSYYSEEIPFDGLIEVGEELQFRAIVKPGDGWKYAKLTDLKVYMVNDNEFDQLDNSQSEAKSGKDRKDSVKFDSNKSSSVDKETNKLMNHKKRNNEVAILVMDNGCRNPVYSALAPYHPYRDTSNPLAVAFNFKAFMFQDMSDDDSIRITAKIMACLEETDCSPSFCSDNGQQGYGRRRRRSITEDYRNNNADESSNNFNGNQHLSLSITHQESQIDKDGYGISSNYPETRDAKASSFSPNQSEINNFSRNFQVKVVLPGYAKTLQSVSNDDVNNEMDTQIVNLHRLYNRSSCKNSLLVLAASSAVLCSAIMLAALWTVRVASRKNNAI